MKDAATFAVALALLLFATRTQAAVYEVGADGAVERLDTRPTPATPAAAKPMRSSVTARQRATALRPYVEAAAHRYEVSAALVDAIAHVESRHNQAAISRAGAGGVMQLMPGTARDMGVDRTDAADNIRGGTAYLRNLLNRFDGNLICTIAAYNAGPGAVSKARCIPRYKETISYVDAVLDRLAEAAR
jgi:soluble lytic murein transglycosylase-like protein